MLPSRVAMALWILWLIIIVGFVVATRMYEGTLSLEWRWVQWTTLFLFISVMFTLVVDRIIKWKSDGEDDWTY